MRSRGEEDLPSPGEPPSSSPKEEEGERGPHGPSPPPVGGVEHPTSVRATLAHHPHHPTHGHLTPTSSRPTPGVSSLSPGGVGSRVWKVEFRRLFPWDQEGGPGTGGLWTQVHGQ